MSDESDRGARLDSPFEFLYHTGEGKQSLHRTSSEQYAAVNKEPADTNADGNSDFAEHIGQRYLSSLSEAVPREHESLVHELAPASALAEPTPTLSGEWYDTVGGGAPVYLTRSFFAELDDIDEAAILANQARYGTQDQLSFEDADGVVTQFGEGGFAATRLDDFDTANDDLIALANPNSPDSATNTSTLTLNPNILRLLNDIQLGRSMATCKEIVADFADLIAGRVHLGHFGDEILLSTGDIDISAELADLMAQPMSTTATQGSSNAGSFNEAMSPASIRYANRAMSVASSGDISDAVSDVSGDDVDEVMSEALNGPNFYQANEKGKGKAVEGGEDGDNEKGKAPAMPDATRIHNNDDRLPCLTDDQVDPLGLVPVTRPADAANPFTFHHPDAVNPYTSEIATLYQRAHLASAGARELSELWKKKLDENEKIFRDKRKELADLGIATTRRRNERRDAGGIMNKKNFENATPERKAYLLKTYEGDVKIRELIHLCECKVDCFNGMADEMATWKKIVLKLVATLSKMRTGVAMGMRGPRENFFDEGEIYYLDNTEVVLKAGYGRWKAINDAIQKKIFTNDGREFAGDLEDFIQIQRDVRAAKEANEGGDEVEEAEKVYTTSDDEDESE